MINEIKVICEAIINRNITPKYIDFNQIKVEIAKFYKDFEIQKERAKKKVLKKAFSKCDDYLMDVREELNLI